MSDEEIVFDRNKLKGRIKEVFSTQQNFAKAVGMSESSVSSRLNNETELSNKEIRIWAEKLGILENILEYFFTIVVQKQEQKWMKIFQRIKGKEGENEQINKLSNYIFGNRADFNKHKNKFISKRTNES